MDEEHSAARKKYRWWPPTKRVTHIFVALVAVGALLFVFGDYYPDKELNRLSTVLGAATVVAAVVVLIRVGQRHEWTGFGESVRPKPDNEEVQPRKTLWDWLQLFIVPLALAAIGLWFAAQQDFRQQKNEEERADSAQQIEEQRAQDAALQAYLDQMSQLLLAEDLRSSKEDGEVRTLAQARTQTVLTRLEGRRKGSVVQFLYEASLINKKNPVVSLSSSFPPEAAPKDVNVGLRKADLSGADLSGADLSYAQLSEAKLIGANLSDADLGEADLTDATLSDANLNGAILFDADLTDAEGVTEEELINQTRFLEGATMPDGSRHD
jgi:hypothetical protein